MNDRPGDPQSPPASEEPELVLTIENAIEDRVRALRQLLRKKRGLTQANRSSEKK